MGAPDLLSGAGPCSVLTATRARAEPRINGGQRVALGRKGKEGNGSAETGRSGNSRGTPTASDGDGSIAARYTVWAKPEVYRAAWAMPVPVADDCGRG